LSHLAAALALAPGAPGAGELHEAMGDLLTLQGAYTRAMMAYETAAAVNGVERLAHLEHKLGLVHMRQGQWELADARFAAAAEAGDDSAAALYADWSLCAHRQGDNQRAGELARQSLRMAGPGRPTSWGSWPAASTTWLPPVATFRPAWRRRGG